MSNPYDNNPIYSADVMNVIQDIESLKGLPEEDYEFEADNHFWRSAHDDTDEYMIKYGTSLTYYKYADGLPDFPSFYTTSPRTIERYPVIVKPITSDAPEFYTCEVISGSHYLCKYTKTAKTTTAVTIQAAQSAFGSRFTLLTSGADWFGVGTSYSSTISPKYVWWTGGSTYHSVFDVYETVDLTIDEHYFRGWLHVERNISDNSWVDYTWIYQLLTPYLSSPSYSDIHCSTTHLALTYYMNGTYYGVYCVDYINGTVKWSKSIPTTNYYAKYYVHSSNTLVTELKYNNSTTSTITKYYTSDGTTYRTGTVGQSYTSNSGTVSFGDSSYTFGGTGDYNFFTIGSSTVYSYQWDNWYSYLFNLVFSVDYWRVPDYNGYALVLDSSHNLTSTDIADDDFLSKEVLIGANYCYIPVNTKLITQIQNVADYLVGTFHDWGKKPTDDVGSGYWGPLGTTFYQYYFPHSDYGLNTDPEEVDVQSDWYGLTVITYGINIGECAEMISAIKGMMEGNYYSL